MIIIVESSAANTCSHVNSDHSSNSPERLSLQIDYSVAFLNKPIIFRCMKSIFIAIATLFLSLTGFAQSPGCEWVNFPTGTPNTNFSYVYGSDYDKYGNSFIVGIYDVSSGTMDLDPSVNSHTVTGRGLFVAKYSPAGSMLWLAPIAAVMLAPQAGFAVPVIACDSFGDVYITGGVKDVTVDFNYVSGSNVPLGTAGGGDMYLAKYSASGAPLWAFIIGATGNEQGEALVCEGSKVYVGGFYAYNTDFDPSPAVYVPVIPNTCSAGFIALYTSNGDFVWQKSFQGITPQTYGNCDVSSLVVDQNKDIIASGVFWGQVDFDADPNQVDTLTVVQGGFMNSYYISKYDSTGSHIFARDFKNYNGSVFGELAIDHNNNIVVGGYLDGIVDFDLGAGVQLDTAMYWQSYTDCFIARYDNSGNYLWHGQFASSNYDFINDLAVDDNNNVLVCGTTRGILDCDMGPGTYNIAVNGNCNGCDDGFVAKYTPTGQLLLAFSISDFANEGVGAVDCYQNRFSITGVFSALTDFDPSADTMMIPAIYTNGYNYFHAQYFDSTFVSGISAASIAAEPVHVYPNPSSDYIHLENCTLFGSYAVVNVAGQIVQTGKQAPTIDVRNLAAGTYLLTLEDENGVVARTKFVKQ